MRLHGGPRGALAVAACAMAAACGKSPAAIEVKGTMPLSVSQPHVPLPKAVAVDADGVPLDPQPELVWEVTPPGRALAGPEGLTVAENGDIVLAIRTADGVVKRTFPIKLQRVDTVELRCKPSCAVSVGDEFTVLARALAGGAEVEGHEPMWTVPEAAKVDVVVPGKYRALVPGEIVIEATIGNAFASQKISVDGSPDTVKVRCPSGGCKVSAGRALQIPLELSRRGVAVPANALKWAVDEPSIAMVSQLGWVLGHSPGKTKIRVWGGSGADELELEVGPESGNLGDPAARFRCSEDFKEVFLGSTLSAKDPAALKKLKYKKNARKAMSDVVVNGGKCESEAAVRCMEKWFETAGTYSPDEVTDMAPKCCCKLQIVLKSK